MGKRLTQRRIAACVRKTLKKAMQGA